MPKWLQLPAEKFYNQPSQMAFLDAISSRRCDTCRQEYKANPPEITCPSCKAKGQRLFDRLTIIAGRRFGKTKIGSIAGVREATVPHSIGWTCAPTNPKLHRYIIPAFQQLIPPEWVSSWNSEHLDLRLKNGALLHFQTLEDPDQGRGQGLDWLYIDEVCELSKAHWEVIRPSLAGDTVAFFTTTPRGYDWAYTELYKPAEQGLPGYWACHAKTSESANPRISGGFLDREKAQMSDEMFRQEYEADFVVFQGAVYGGLVDPQVLRHDEAVRAIIPEWPQIHPSRQVLVGIDTGADHPFGGVKVVVTERGLVVCGEYLSRRENRTFVEHAHFLKQLAGTSNVKWAINKNEKQPMIELAQHQMFCTPANNDVIAGTERVKAWLTAKQLFIVESRCPLTVQQLKGYRWADNYSPKDESKKVKEKVFKKEDELPDCLRYVCMVYPQLPKAALPDSRRDLTKMPEETRAAIERMRRLDQDPPKSLNDTSMMDFYS